MTNPAADVMGIGGGFTSGPAERFLTHAAQLSAPAVLEIGTLRWQGDMPTHHEAWVPHAKRYIKSDVEAGTDVDVVADAHDLRPFRSGSLDVVIACAVWEHLARPWVAAKAVRRVLRPGGVVFVSTHQTFPLHGYPHDYFRFSAAALTLLFEDAGLETVAAAYSYPCRIIPPAEVTRWNPDAQAWLNVDYYGRRP